MTLPSAKVPSFPISQLSCYTSGHRASFWQRKKKPSLQIKWPTGKTHFPQEQSNSRCNLIRWYKTLSVLSLLTYLCDWQLQLNDILRLGHRGLQRRVQEQDAVQILPTSHCIVVHKQHLVHCREVLASDATAGLGCGTNTPSTKCSDGKGQATSTEATAHQVKMQNQLNLPRSVIWCQSWHYGCMINTKHQITYKGWTIMENNHWLTHWQRYSCYKEPYLKGSRSLLANTTSTVVIPCASVVTWLLSFAKQGGLFFYCMSLHPSSSLLALCHAARKSSGQNSHQISNQISFCQIATLSQIQFIVQPDHLCTCPVHLVSDMDKVTYKQRWVVVWLGRVGGGSFVGQAQNNSKSLDTIIIADIYI